MTFRSLELPRASHNSLPSLPRSEMDQRIARYIQMENDANHASRGYIYHYRNRFEKAMGLIANCATPPARILDVAGGNGHFSLFLAEAGYDVTWLDLRGELREYITRNHRQGKLRFLVANAFEYEPEPGERYDLVFASEVIEHCAHPDQFLRKLATFISKDGSIVVTTPNGKYFRNKLPRFSDCPDASVFEAVQFRPDSDGHIFLLDTGELESLARDAGLRLDVLTLYTNPLTNGHVRLRHFLPLLPHRIVRALDRGTQCLPRIFSERIHTGMAAVLRPHPACVGQP
jgi:2-polyprenyl-3-methyl-5-hydroxy-6-metoxy-1,4-benzoquinol methylase